MRTDKRNPAHDVKWRAEADPRWRRITRHMKRCLFALGIMFCGFIASGQAPRNYAIAPPRVSYSADAVHAIIRFEISNRGGDASAESRIVITEHQSGGAAHSESLPAIPGGESRAFEVPPSSWGRDLG